MPRKFQHPSLKLEASGMDTIEYDSIHELIRSWWIYQKVEKTPAGHRQEEEGEAEKTPACPDPERPAGEVGKLSFEGRG